MVFEDTPLPSPDGLVRRGTSLLEVMLAVSIMATALLAAFGHIANVRNLQDSTLAKELSAIAASNIAALCAGSSSEEISTWTSSGNWIGDVDDRATWSTTQDLIGLGLLPPQNLMEHSRTESPFQLFFAVGMYRVLPNTSNGSIIASEPGFWPLGTGMETQVTAFHDPSQSFADNVTRRRPSKVTDPKNQVTPGNPVAVFVTVWKVYRDDPGGEPQLVHSHLSSFATPQ
jgi:hypothetical protein